MAYTQLASGSWGSGPAIPYTFYYEKSRNGTNMIYKIKVVLGAITGSSHFGYPINCSINCGGKTASSQMKAASPSQWSSALTYETGNLTVTDKISGTTSLTITLTGVGAPRGSTNYVYNLPIDPAVSSVSCAGGNIGEAATIKINKGVAAYTHTLKYSFSGLSGTIATKTSASEVSWTIPTTFFAKIPNSKSGTGTISCTTYNGNTSIGTTTCQFTARVSSASIPTMSPTVMDVRNVTIALTGNANNLILGESTASCAMNAQAKDSATIKSATIKNGNDTFSAQTATIYNPTSSEFVFTVVDSRGYVKMQNVTKTTINYHQPTCALTFNSFSSTGVASLTIAGSAWKGNFGVTNNTLTVQYRYKKDSGSWGSWTSATASWNNDGTYQINLTFQNFDYRAKYTFQARAKDALHTEGVLSNTVSKQALPLFYWDEDSFNVNVPFNVNANAQINGNLTGNYLQGTWLKTTSTYNYSGDTSRFCVLDNEGWVYTKTVVDFVVDQGTSGIWTYRKWNSGIAECWCRYAINGVQCNSGVGNWYKTDNIQLPNYPFTFVADPEINMFFETHTGTGGMVWSAELENPTSPITQTKPGMIYIIRMTSSNSISGWVNASIKGRWK